MKWDQEKLKWEIVHYSHNFNDFIRMCTIYPQSETCVHMIDINYMKSHGIMEQVEAIKQRCRNVSG